MFEYFYTTNKYNPHWNNFYLSQIEPHCSLAINCIELYGFHHFRSSVEGSKKHIQHPVSIQPRWYQKFCGWLHIILLFQEAYWAHSVTDNLSTNLKIQSGDKSILLFCGSFWEAFSSDGTFHRRIGILHFSRNGIDDDDEIAGDDDSGDDDGNDWDWSDCE